MTLREWCSVGTTSTSLDDLRAGATTALTAELQDTRTGLGLLVRLLEQAVTLIQGRVAFRRWCAPDAADGVLATLRRLAAALQRPVSPYAERMCATLWRVKP